MRIGLVNEYFPPHAPGGAEWSTYYLGRRLVEAGHKVVVITPNYGSPGYEERDGMRIHRFWFPQKIKEGHLVRSSLHSNPLFYLYSAFQIWRRARQEQVKVLHAQGKYSLAGTFIAAKLLRVPSIVTLRDMQSLCVSGGLCLHERAWVPDDCGFVKGLGCLRAFDLKYNPDKDRLYRLKFYADYLLLKKPDLWLRSWFLKRVDKVITVSDGLREIYVQAGRFPAERSQTIYNLPPPVSDISVDADAIREKYGLQARRIVLTVGKMSFGKGTDVLIQAVPKVLESVPDALFVFVGRKNPLIIVPEKLQGHVKMLGVLPHEEVMELYAAADVVTVPSVWPEPLSRVLLEAMSVGKPVVATRVGGTSEMVIHQRSGLLVERQDPTGLAQAVVKILQDSELRRRTGEEGQRILVEKLNPEQLLEGYISLYQAVLDR